MDGVATAQLRNLRRECFGEAKLGSKSRLASLLQGRLPKAIRTWPDDKQGAERRVEKLQWHKDTGWKAREASKSAFAIIAVAEKDKEGGESEEEQGEARRSEAKQRAVRRSEEERSESRHSCAGAEEDREGGASEEEQSEARRRATKQSAEKKSEAAKRIESRHPSAEGAAGGRAKQSEAK